MPASGEVREGAAAPRGPGAPMVYPATQLSTAGQGCPPASRLTAKAGNEHNEPRIAAMRYRRLSYRYTVMVGTSQSHPLGELWLGGPMRLLVQPRWRPESDLYETASTVEIIVDLAGVDEADFELQLFDDALVVEGHRQLPSCHEGAVYQAASIRQGPFQLEVPLPAPIDADRVEARYDRGLLRITLPKRPPKRPEVR